MKKPLDKLDIITSFIYMHSGKFFNEIKEDDDVILASCRDSSEIWWNFAFLKKPIKKEKLQLITNFFKNRKKLPTIYLLNDKKYEKILALLLDEEFTLVSKDYWMFWNKEIPQIDEENIIEIKSDEDFEKWIETFIKSYPKDDPKNPYGEQIEFSKILRKVWAEHKTKNNKYFLAFCNNDPVAVGILTSYNQRGYISAIGSIPSVRGKGFGKKVSLYCVRESFKQGNTSHFLATEKGHFPFDFYEKIGFEPEFTASYYTLNQTKFGAT